MYFLKMTSHKYVRQVLLLCSVLQTKKLSLSKANALLKFMLLVIYPIKMGILAGLVSKWNSSLDQAAVEIEMLAQYKLLVSCTAGKESQFAVTLG